MDDPDTNARLNLVELIGFLQAEAGRLVDEVQGTKPVLVKGLDLRSPPAAKLRKESRLIQEVNEWRS